MIDDPSFEQRNSADYATKLFERLSTMRDGNEFCDLRLRINEKEYLCHKFVLIAASNYLKDICDRSTNESQLKTIQLDEWTDSTDGIEAMINFCYSGSLEISVENLSTLLHAALFLQIDEAIRLCSEYLLEACSMKNCLELYQIAEFYSLEKISPVLRSFISSHFLRLAAEAPEQFHRLTFEQILREISNDDLVLNQSEEYTLFQLVCQWIEGNPSEREQYSIRLFQSIRFMLMSAELLMDHVRHHRLINLHEETRILVEDALCYYALPQRQPLIDREQNRIRNRSSLVAVADNELFVLNSEQNQWESAHRAPIEENYPYPFSALTVKNYLYLLGTRRSPSEEYQSCYRFSARTCLWSRLANLRRDRSRFAAVHHQGYIYILGGFEGFKRPVRVYSTNIDRYSIEEDRWDLFFSDGPELSSFAACADDRSIYFGGGKNAHWSKTADFYSFSLEKCQVERRAAMLNARTGHAFHLVDEEHILAIGGFDDNGNGVLAIERYCIETDQWTILSSIPGTIAKTWPQSIGLVERRLYVSVFHTTNTFMVMQEAHFYDIDHQQWISAPVIHERARYCPTVQLRLETKRFQPLSQ